MMSAEMEYNANKKQRKQALMARAESITGMTIAEGLSTVSSHTIILSITFCKTS